MKHHLSVLSSAAVIMLCLSAGQAVHAQTAASQTFINWQAATYAPATYSGKILPTSDSRIKVTVDVFESGKLIDLSPYKVYWYLNENFYQGSFGLNQITFTAPHFIGKTSVKVRASIPDYPGGPAKTVTIPVVPPEVVIQSSAPSLAAGDTPFNLHAYPYFFNVQDSSELSFIWKVGTIRTGNQNPFVVTRELARNGPTDIELEVTNPVRVLERVTKKLTLFLR